MPTRPSSRPLRARQPLRYGEPRCHSPLQAAAGAILIALAIGAFRPLDLRADESAPPAGIADYGASSNTAKAQALVQTAINLTDSDRALKLLWQATDIDPQLQDPYIYLGLYYNSRSDFDKVIQVYQKLVKYQPKESSAYLNIGEAYMSFSPPRTGDALVYYHKALDLDPSSSFAASGWARFMLRRAIARWPSATSSSPAATLRIPMSPPKRIITSARWAPPDTAGDAA